MLSSVDPIGKIQQIYREGTRKVPYTMFMNVFNELLADPSELVPREPSPELRERFRALCMAANVGVADPEGRGDERVQEFLEKVYPVWRDELPAEEFEEYERIVEGRMRERFRGARQEGAPEVEAPAGAGESARLLKRLGLVEGEPEEEAAAGAGEPLAEVFGSVDRLIAAAKDGRIEPRLTTRQEDEEWTRYRLGDHEVSVKLARTDGQLYVVLGTDVGYEGVPEAGVRITDIAAEMRYVRMSDYAYLREGEEATYTLKVGPRRATIASGLDADTPPRDLLVQIQRLHRDLGELVERIES
ncbi:MAG: hypothetical protein PVJ27_11060 [Candidatus Brocadiaceae bacterium]|jgi:hypothetical protein